MIEPDIHDVGRSVVYQKGWIDSHGCCHFRKMVSLHHSTIPVYLYDMVLTNIRKERGVKI